tara:strand:- start:176 stop:367 length:192 start_codon:yes stop_codon:yes gene_type:complete
MIMVKEFCRTDMPRGQMVDSTTKKPWVQPEEGIATVDVKFEIDAPSGYVNMRISRYRVVMLDV